MSKNVFVEKIKQHVAYCNRTRLDLEIGLGLLKGPRTDALQHSAGFK